MSDPEEARRMLEIAKRDFRALGGMVSDPDTFCDEIFGFHAEQTVEKALKSWLAVVVGAYPRVHDLEDLFNGLKDAGAEVPDQFLAMVDFVDFAVQYRYSAFDDEAGLDREALHGLVAGLVAHVERLVRTADELG